MFRDLEASESLSFLDHQLGQSPVSTSRDACRVETETLARLTSFGLQSSAWKEKIKLDL